MNVARMPSILRSLLVALPLVAAACGSADSPRSQTATAPATETALATQTQPAADSTPSTPAAGLTWDADIGPLLQTKCGACHGEGALGGLNVTTYADAMRGGVSGPVILPGDSANSLLVIKQQAGGHPGQLTPEEIAQIIEWIDAGALEN